MAAVVLMPVWHVKREAEAFDVGASVHGLQLIRPSPFRTGRLYWAETWLWDENPRGPVLVRLCYPHLIADVREGLAK